MEGSGIPCFHCLWPALPEKLEVWAGSQISTLAFIDEQGHTQTHCPAEMWLRKEMVSGGALLYLTQILSTLTLSPIILDYILCDKLVSTKTQIQEQQRT